jgi:hypothetical protein
MDNHRFRHEHREEEHLTGQEQTARQTALEFENAEQMIRYDAAHTDVPPAVAERLQQSIEREPKPARPWWQRWFGRGE